MSRSTTAINTRICSRPEYLYECFVEVVAPNPNSGNPDPWILQKYPDSYNNQEVLKTVANFTYPCDIEISAVQHFSFVLTNSDGKWTFGFCRHAASSQTCLCILSLLPWHEAFYKILNTVAEITQRKETGDLLKFLEVLRNSKIPHPGTELHIRSTDGAELKYPCPDHTKLPRIPDNRNLTEYYNAVDSHNMMVIFASLLHERRILITSSKLSRLSACIQAANTLIYPMQWQHIFIPVLPFHLIDYLSAPMPYLVGVPTPLFNRVRKSELGDVVILYADKNKVETPFDDLGTLPTDIVSSLKHSLKQPTFMLHDGVARAFLQTLVLLIGGYRDALQHVPSETKITFNPELFLQSRSVSMQPFLEKILQLQIFHQFIEERLQALNGGKEVNDFFEEEVQRYMEKHGDRGKMAYKEWMGNVRKEGGALLKSVKNKVKDKSKRAYKEMRNMFQEGQEKEDGDVSPSSEPGTEKPRSAPSSPMAVRARPITVHGMKHSPSSPNTDQLKNNNVKTYVRRPVRMISEPHRKSPQYNLLEGEEVNADALMLSPNEFSFPLDGNHYDGRNKSPATDIVEEDELHLRRLSMDLMGDLQDLIFRKCSLGDEVEVEMSRAEETRKSLKPSHSAECLPTLFSIFPPDTPPPLPPPRTKYLSTAAKNIEKPSSPDTCLIRLDSDSERGEASITSEFDPLMNANPRSTGQSPYVSPLNGNVPRNTFISNPLYSQPPNLFGKTSPMVTNQNPFFSPSPPRPLNNPFSPSTISYVPNGHACPASRPDGVPSTNLNNDSFLSPTPSAHHSHSTPSSPARFASNPPSRESPLNPFSDMGGWNPPVNRTLPTILPPPSRFNYNHDNVPPRTCVNDVIRVFENRDRAEPPPPSRPHSLRRNQWQTFD